MADNGDNGDNGTGDNGNPSKGPPGPNGDTEPLRCGQFGGRRANGHPCQRRVSGEWKCPFHDGTFDATTSERKRKAGESITVLQAKYIEAYAECGLVGKACATAGVGRTTELGWRHDPSCTAYHDALRMATEISGQNGLDELYRRAVEGVAEPVFYQGEAIGAIRKYSDRCLELFLKSRFPEMFRERHEVEHSGGVAMRIDEMRASIQKIFDRPDIARSLEDEVLGPASRLPDGNGSAGDGRS